MTLKEGKAMSDLRSQAAAVCVFANSIGLLLHKLNITKTTRFDKIILKRYIIFYFFWGVNVYEDFINVVV